MNPPISSLAARESRGGGLSGIVLAAEHALAERRPDDLRDAVCGAERDDLVLGLAPQQRILRLAGDELRDVPRRQGRAPPGSGRRAIRKSRCSAPCRSPRRGSAPPSSPRAACRVVAVALVEIDIIGAQPLQRGVELLFDLRARQARDRCRSSGRTPWSPARSCRAAGPAAPRPGRSPPRRGRRRWRCR